MLTFDEYFSSIDLLQNIEYAWHYVLCSTFINCFIKRHYFDFQVTLISLSLKGKFLWDFMNYQNIKVIFLSILFYTCFRFWYIKWKKKQKQKPFSDIHTVSERLTSVNSLHARWFDSTTQKRSTFIEEFWNMYARVWFCFISILIGYFLPV